MISTDLKDYHRRSIRLKGYDYTQAGGYFVTLVTWGYKCIFGEIVEGNMHLNPYGTLVVNEWRRLENRFQQVVVDEWIVMPNHLHGIILMVENESIDTVRARQEDSSRSGGSSFASPLQDTPHSNWRGFPCFAR